MNKLDPLQLDEFKFIFLEKAEGADVAVTVAKLRQIIKLVLNSDTQCFEERIIQALTNIPNADDQQPLDEDTVEVSFD